MRCFKSSFLVESVLLIIVCIWCIFLPRLRYEMTDSGFTVFIKFGISFLGGKEVELPVTFLVVPSLVTYT